MEGSSSSSSSSSSADPLLQRLTTRGWYFSDLDQVKSIAAVHSGAGLELELCNLDLRSVGAKSLPDTSSLLRKSPQLRFPIVLQVASVRDVSRSSFASGASNRRMLKLMLTDGHTELTAIEYSHIPSLPDDVVPGTKIRLEKKPIVHGGILCLVPNVITVLGGVVQTLYEEWEMNQKYLGFSRSSVKSVREGESGGPPSFEKLQIGGSKPSSSQNASGKDASKVMEAGAGYGTKQIHRQHIPNAKADKKDNDPKGISTSQGIEDKPSTSQSRPKEVAECAPVQNQAAAQKLLQKMSQPEHKNQYQRGQRYRGRAMEEDKPVFTLDEWERRKAGASTRVETPDITCDEDLARLLQNQFDLEDEVQMDPHTDPAADIRMSMFSFERDDGGAHGRTGFRGRGRGRGRSRGRGRGRGRGGF